jgi:hypothetical protein
MMKKVMTPNEQAPTVERSLRDLNLILKTGKEPPKPMQRNCEQQKVDRVLQQKVWIKGRHLEYRTEVSVLNRCKDRLPRNVCPHCQHVFYSQDLLEETDASYVYRCYECGAFLNILKA